jgi:hypothetical protein
MRKALLVGAIALAGLTPRGIAQTGVVRAKVRDPRAVMLVAMPEPSTPAILSVDVLLVGLVISLFRRRASDLHR